MSNFKLVIINLSLSILLTLNIFIFHSPILGVIFGLSFIILSSYLLGQLLFKTGWLQVPLGAALFSPKDKTDTERTNGKFFLGFLLFLSTTIIVLTIIYYFYQLNNYIIAVYIILLSIILITMVKHFRVVPRLSRSCRGIIPRSSAIKTWFNSPSIIFTLTYLSLLTLSYFTLKSGATFEAVRTPWLLISKWFFLIYFLATLNLIYLTTRLKPLHSLILISLHLFFTFSITNIIFPLGFGYDPFIHQATEKYILEHGFILPKNFYYLGQYSLVVFLTKIFQISHVIIDKNLVPFLAALLLPATIYCTFKKLSTNNQPFDFIQDRQLTIKNDKKPLFLYFSISLFLFLIIPFSIFTFTTPQNLADLFVIIIAFLGLNFILNNYGLRITDYKLLVLMTLTILLIHPLAGLAALIFITILWLTRFKVKKVFKNLIFVFSCFCVFCVFVLFSWLSPLYQVELANNFNLINFYHNSFRGSPDLFLNTNFVHLIKTIAYFLWQPIVLFLIIFSSALLGLFLVKRQEHPSTHSASSGQASFRAGKNTETNPFITLLLYYFITFIILFINSLLIFSFLNFPFLIDYERGDFSWRIFNLGVWFLVPLAILGVWKILTQIIKLLNYQITKFHEIPRLHFVWLGMTTIIISAAVTISLYFSYPRQDIYAINKGFNTSIHDFNVIRYLDNITPEPYVVLSNQQVGAAALTTFGFRYIDNQYFFYSIPTGGELYKIYAKMAYDGEISYEVAKEAIDLTGVNIVYFYLNDYWFNFKKIKPLLGKAAIKVMRLENGKVWVFKFVRK